MGEGNLFPPPPRAPGDLETGWGITQLSLSLVSTGASPWFVLMGPGTAGCGGPPLFPGGGVSLPGFPGLLTWQFTVSAQLCLKTPYGQPLVGGCGQGAVLADGPPALAGAW